MKPGMGCRLLALAIALAGTTNACLSTGLPGPPSPLDAPQATRPDSLRRAEINGAPSFSEPPRPNIWGVDILLSNDGFGLGTFFRHELDPDISLFANFSISEAKDSRETVQYDPYFNTSFTPGKLNRFLVLPLMLGMQYRLFREDIADNFRPYVNAGVGPVLVYVMPYLDIMRDGTNVSAQEVEFFSSIGRGQPHYTAGGFIGFGANFGTDKTSVLGLNFRYYFTYLFSSGVPSLVNPGTGDLVARKKDFGGFFITVNLGTVL